MFFEPPRYKNLNIDLAQQVLDHVTNHPEEHCQGGWGYRDPVCGTSACIGGWTCIYGTPELAEQDEFGLLKSMDGKPGYRAAQLLGLEDDYHWLLINIFGEWNDERAILKFRFLIEDAKKAQHYDRRKAKELKRSGRTQATIHARDLANMKAANK